MHPNLFVSVLLTVFAGLVLGAVAFLLILLVSKITRRSSVRRIVPGLMTLALCLSVLRSMDSIRRFVERLHYEHGLNKLFVLGLLAAALAVGVRLAFRILGAWRQPED